MFDYDETWLFWKKLLNRMYITQEDKAMKYRLILLLCVKESTNLKSKPLLMYYTHTTEAFKEWNVSKATLTFMWRANAKAWVTRQLFTQ